LREFAQAEEIVNAAIEMASDSAHPNQVLDAQAQGACVRMDDALFLFSRLLHP